MSYVNAEFIRGVGYVYPGHELHSLDVKKDLVKKRLKDKEEKAK